MSRVNDLGVTIGLLPSGPTGSILDVPGAGVGHATVWRDEPDPPAGRGIARTGVTVIDPGGNLFREPIRPAVPSSTGRASAPGSWRHSSGASSRHRSSSRRPCSSAGSSTPPAEGAVGSGAGMSCLGFKGGIGTASRIVPSGHVVGVLAMTNFGSRERLTVDGVPVGRLLPPSPRSRVCPAIRVVHRRGAHQCAARLGRLHPAGPPGRARPRPHRLDSQPLERRDLPGGGDRVAAWARQPGPAGERDCRAAVGAGPRSSPRCCAGTAAPPFFQILDDLCSQDCTDHPRSRGSWRRAERSSVSQPWRVGASQPGAAARKAGCVHVPTPSGTTPARASGRSARLVRCTSSG